jgi:FG-GAP repeat
MNGTNILQSAVIGTASSDWKILGVGDFDGDGKSDVLWVNTKTGQLGIWF